MSGAHATDACIIGAGPAGLHAVFQLGLADLKCHVLDTLDRPGGQCAALYHDKPIYDVPGFTAINGEALTDRLMQQIKPFGARFHFGQAAMRLEPRAPNEAFPLGGWRVVTDAGAAIDCRVAVIAAGGGSLAGKRAAPDWAGSRTRDGLIPVDTATYQTATPGIFAIGDACTYPGKLKLIVSGFHEAALMAQEAFRICQPQKKLRAQYTSSSREVQRRLGV